MNDFSYQRAADLESALRALAGDGAAKCIAGGTNLLDLMKENVERPERLVDISRLPLREISALPGGGLRLGALATNADTAYHEDVANRYPLLARALLAGASPQLRNMATNGGNLLQRTRCYYFYDVATPCNKRDPGAGCSAVGGLTRMHAFLGASEHCIAVHPSDMCVALAALNASVRVAGPGGERVIPMVDFHRLPGSEPDRETDLGPGEIVTAIDLPAEGFADHYAYLKIRDRKSYAFALVSVAAALRFTGGRIAEARIALGGVAHKPWRDPGAEVMLRDKEPSVERFRSVAAEILKDARGQGGNDFKIVLARRAIVRALSHAADMGSRS